MCDGQRRDLSSLAGAGDARREVPSSVDVGCWLMTSRSPAKEQQTPKSPSQDLDHAHFSSAIPPPPRDARCSVPNATQASFSRRISRRYHHIAT